MSDLYKMMDSASSIAESNELIIEFDISGEEKSLLTMIESVRSQINERPDDFPVILYFVGGNKLTNNDWPGLVNYINSLPNPLQIVYRGIVYPETLKI